jgi:tRNA G18 (ribose-2'-O)-methylase SpoU
LSSSDPLLPFRDLQASNLAAEGLFVVEGVFLAERLLRSSCRIHSLLCVPAAAPRFRDLADGRCPVVVAEESELRGIVGYRFHRGVLACGYRPSAAPLPEVLGGAEPESGRLLVLCPDLNDDANLGSILRSALAFGAAGALLGSRCCDPYSRRALRLSMGASFLLPVARLSDEDEAARLLRAAGFLLYGAANHPDARELDDAERPLRLVIAIGNEGSGLSEDWLRRCDALVRIPMTSALDSLNAGVAAGIILYALSGPRARRAC